jgi:tRNA (Thr-GGU) A37 N-methylase
MTDDDLELVAVGMAHTPYETTAEAPHQGFADDAESVIEIHAEYADALAGVETYHRLTVLYWAHLVDRERPVDDGAEDGGDADDTNDAGDGADGDDSGDGDDGAFARRGPDRPNPIGVCTCMVLGVDGRRIRVSGLDAVDGSPVVNLKPALQAER